MKEYKYTIEGKEYIVEIGEIADNVADVKVNGEAFKVEMEPEAEPEKKKVVLGQPAAESSTSDEAASPANVNTANAVKAPLPGVITDIQVAVGQQVEAGDVFEQPIDVKRWEATITSLVKFMHALETADRAMFDVRSIGVSNSGKNTGYLKGKMTICCAYLREEGKSK